METSIPTPPRGSVGPRSPMACRIVALEPGATDAWAYARRSTVAALASFWANRLGRVYVTRKDRHLIRVYRLA